MTDQNTHNTSICPFLNPTSIQK